uniref:F-box domain-containing protein n=1 Tax=Setaria italica TaxID=4555 RepID=K3YLF1_SETIT
MASKRSKRVASLPDEIVSEILLLLPARSVLRCRAVCRRWAAELSSPGFMDAYAARAGARRTSKLELVVFAASPGHRSTAAYSCSGQGGAHAADPLFAVDHLRTDFLSLSSRPCRGLMLFSDTRTVGSYWVCNPSTGERRPLPLPPQHRGQLTLSSAGLVIDGRNMECKVVHLFYKVGSEWGLKCEVYTLGERSRRWRRVTVGLEWLRVNETKVTRALQTEEAVTRVPPVHADGCLYWLLYPCDMGDPPGQNRDGATAILRFSAADESFGFVDVPAGLPMEDYVSLEEHSPAVPVHLAELKGSLCMVHDLRHQGHGPSSLDVWVLRGRDAGGWSLDYRIPATPLMARDVHGPRFITVLGCIVTGKQEKLLVATSEHKVYAFATDTGRVETVFSIGETTGIGLQKEAAAALWIGLYEDSLVRIGGGASRREEEVLSAVAEILLRLPLKSIAQSMLVCRRWRAVIESESFVRRHAMSSMESAKKTLMVTSGRARRAFFNFTPMERWLDQASPAGLAAALANGKIICSKPCHGLNLISTSSDDYLCNPCTGDIKCLGIRGKSRFGPRCNDPQAAGRHAFTVGRQIGFGFDRSTGEHVAVEIGHLCGTLACMLKTSESDSWTCAGTPPMPVTDMPPAHVDGTLYWMAERTQEATASSSHQGLVIVAFDISARRFDTLRCDQPRLDDDHGAFLVELNNMLSLVATNRQVEEMVIWVMRGKRGAWVEAHRVCLRGQPSISPRTTVAVPLEISSGDGRILLSTGRTLGYYDTRTGALDTVYSLDHLQLAPYELAFPMLCQESLVRVPDDDELPVGRVAPPPVSSHNGRHGSCNDHPELVDVDDAGRTPRSIFYECQNAGCRGNGDVYSACCKRLICVECLRQCPGHYRGQHFPLSTIFDDGVVEGIRRHGLPMEHPFVPDPDCYGYYYSAIDDDDVARHVFVSLRDFVRCNQPCHLIECAYRMDGHGKVIETWVRRYLKVDFGELPLA